MKDDKYPIERTLTIEELEALAREAYEKEQERRKHLSPEELKKVQEADEHLQRKWSSPYH